MVKHAMQIMENGIPYMKWSSVYLISAVNYKLWIIRRPLAFGHGGFLSIVTHLGPSAAVNLKLKS